MKITTKKTLGGIALGAALLIPSFTFAADASFQGGVGITGDGIVRVMGAQVTSISGNIINAVSNIKNTVLNWSVTTNASTTVRAGAGATSTLSGIAVGDKINLEGALTSFGSTMGITASKVMDVTARASSTASSTWNHDNDNDHEGHGKKDHKFGNGFFHGLKLGLRSHFGF